MIYLKTTIFKTKNNELLHISFVTLCNLFLIKSIKIDKENDLFRYKTLTKAKLSVYHLSLVIRLAREMTLADNLVIVESPAKAKTIEKYLGKKYKVIASMGHVRDLPRSQMGVDTEDNYEQNI